MYIYIPKKESEFTIPIPNQYGKLKGLIKTLFCRNLVAINIWNSLILKDVAIIKSDVLKHYVCVGVGTKITAFIWPLVWSSALIPVKVFGIEKVLWVHFSL